MQRINSRNLFRRFASLLVLVACLTSTLLAQTSAGPAVTKMNVRATIDELGNGHVTLTFEMTAQQWAGWKEQYGNNPSMFKRDMSKYFSMYDVTDFQLEQNDMDRKAIVTIAANGMAEYHGGGVYEIVADKEMGEGEFVENEVRYTFTQSDGPGSITLVDQRLALPDGAKDVEQTTNGKGERVVKYELASSSSGPPWNLIAALAGVLGVCLFACSFVVPGAEG